MIIKFNPSLFEIEDRAIQREILKFILDFLNDSFIWDLDNINEIFGNDGEFYNTKFARAMIADGLSDHLADNLDLIFKRSSYLTKAHKHYLSTITVGTGKNEIHPLNAHGLLSLASVVVLENGDNDWNFIKGIVDNYQSQKDRKPIYALIKKAIDTHRLIPENAGGSGGILKRTRFLAEGTYQNFFTVKMALVFDSDRSNASGLNDKWVPLLSWLKKRTFEKKDVLEFESSNSDLIGWHMLYKREMENYIPLEMLYLKAEIKDTNKVTLASLTPSEHDFYNFDGILVDPELKNELPTLFQNKGIRPQLESRCAHHKIQVDIPGEILEEVCELEKILLIIAKII